MSYGSFKTLVSETLEINQETELRFKLDENTRNGNLILQIREFKTGGEYIGPTRNGVTYRVESVEDVDALEEKFIIFLKGVREEVSK